MNDLFTKVPNNPIFLAPMFEVTNLPFRLFCREQGANVGVSEFVSANQLYYVFKNDLLHNSNLEYMIDNDILEKPVGLQVFGFDAEIFKMLGSVFDFHKTGFDFLDLNVGCPVPKICNIGAGSKLLDSSNLSALEEILKTITHTFPDVPFSIKIRAGYKKLIDFDKFTEMINAINLSHITIHPKLAVNLNKNYPNSVNHEFSSQLVELSDHPVIINGDITSLSMADELVAKTNAKGSMIGRQAQKYPWVFNKNYQEMVPAKVYINDLIHFISLNKEFGFRKLYMVRDQILGMVRGFPGSKLKRSEIQTKLSSLDELEAFILNVENHFKSTGIEFIKNIVTKTTVSLPSK